MWYVRIHKLVLKNDFKSIPSFKQKKLLTIIHQKLSKEPELFGKPLIGELKGYWRLRIQDYRVIYRINKKTVEILVVKIGARKDHLVYNDFIKRLKKI